MRDRVGAVGSMVRPNRINGHFWHSNYWNSLFEVHEELDVTMGFHVCSRMSLARLRRRFSWAALTSTASASSISRKRHAPPRRSQPDAAD